MFLLRLYSHGALSVVFFRPFSSRFDSNEVQAFTRRRLEEVALNEGIFESVRLRACSFVTARLRKFFRLWGQSASWEECTVEEGMGD